MTCCSVRHVAIGVLSHCVAGPLGQVCGKATADTAGDLLSPLPHLTYLKANQAKHPVQVRGKAMADKAGDLLDLFHDVLLTARLDDKARFRQVRLLSSLKHPLYALPHAGEPSVQFCLST